MEGTLGQSLNYSLHHSPLPYLSCLILDQHLLSEQASSSVRLVVQQAYLFVTSLRLLLTYLDKNLVVVPTD